MNRSASTQSSQAVFRARGISKIYRMGEVEVHALRSIDLDLYEGELVVLLGASGSGKSTLLNILGGLDVPTSGRVFFHDRELTAIDDKALTQFRRERVGFVFQFYNLIPSLTALENVELVTEIAVNPMPAEDALQLVGLGDRLHHFPAQLSGGEQQRVAIARAVAKRPEVLLCDEPTGAGATSSRDGRMRSWSARRSPRPTHYASGTSWAQSSTGAGNRSGLSGSRSLPSTCMKSREGARSSPITGALACSG